MRWGHATGRRQALVATLLPRPAPAPRPQLHHEGAAAASAMQQAVEDAVLTAERGAATTRQGDLMCAARGGGTPAGGCCPVLLLGGGGGTPQLIHSSMRPHSFRPPHHCRRRDILDLSSPLNDAAAAIVDDSFLRCFKVCCSLDTCVHVCACGCARAPATAAQHAACGGRVFSSPQPRPVRVPAAGCEPPGPRSSLCAALHTAAAEPGGRPLELECVPGPAVGAGRGGAQLHPVPPAVRAGGGGVAGDACGRATLHTQRAAGADAVGRAPAACSAWPPPPPAGWWRCCWGRCSLWWGLRWWGRCSR